MKMNVSYAIVVMFLTFIAIFVLSWAPKVDSSPSPRRRGGGGESSHGGGRSSYRSGSYSGGRVGKLFKPSVFYYGDYDYDHPYTFNEWDRNARLDGWVCRNDRDCEWINPFLGCDDRDFQLNRVQGNWPWKAELKGRCTCENGFNFDHDTVSCTSGMDGFNKPFSGRIRRDIYGNVLDAVATANGKVFDWKALGIAIGVLIAISCCCGCCLMCKEIC